MSKKIVAIVGIVSLLFVTLIVVAGQKWHSKNSNRIDSIEFSDPKKDVVVISSAPKFTIVLKSNPSTGYSWSIDQYDSVLLDKVSNKYYPPVSTKSQMVGAPGYEGWVFKAKPEFFDTNKQTEIIFVYKRSWEKESAQILTFKVVPENAN